MHLREYLLKYGITLTSFGDELGVNRTTMHQIASGVYPPTLKLALKILYKTNGEVTLIELAEGPPERRYIKPYRPRKKKEEIK